MSAPISRDDLSHLPREKARRLREMFDVDRWPDPADDGLDHAPGEARPIDNNPPWAIEDAPPPAPGEEGSS